MTASVPAKPPKAAPFAGLAALTAVLNETNGQMRALAILRLPEGYLRSPALHDDVRQLVRSGVTFRAAARRLHPDKVIPYGNITQVPEMEVLRRHATLLWQVCSSITR